MSSIKQAIESQLNDVAVLLLGPFVDWAIENVDSFDGDKTDRDKIISKIAKELKIETNGAKTKISDALKGMGISKSGGSKGKGGSKSKETSDVGRWLTVSEYKEKVADNEGTDYCTYSPPRGTNKDKICTRIADTKNSENTRDIYSYRCDDCADKSGRGKTVLSGKDNTASKSITRNPIPGVTKSKSKRPTEGRSKKKSEDSSSESEEDSDDASGDDSKGELELTPNKSITKLLGKNYFIYTLANIGTCLVSLNEKEQIITFYGKFNSDVSPSTTVTVKMLKELTEVKESKISKKDMSDNFSFSKPSKLDLSKLKKADEEEPAKGKKKAISSDDSSVEEKKEATKPSKPAKEITKPKKKIISSDGEESEEEKKPAKEVSKPKKKIISSDGEESEEEKKPAKPKKAISSDGESEVEEEKPAKEVNKPKKEVIGSDKEESEEKKPASKPSSSSKKVISPSSEEKSKPASSKAKKVISPDEDEQPVQNAEPEQPAA
jgi:hypothetical protein